MGLFQLILTIQANIRDSQWELGVLRSMGMNKRAVLKLTVYESVSVNLASIICGFIIGLLVSVSQIGMFLLFLELPFKIVVPTDVVIVVSVLSVGTMALGCWLGAKELYTKQIASTLKGI
jgi:ABC-type antimicrobial peptide transport system permease subunit